MNIEELRIGNLLDDHGTILPVGFSTFKNWRQFNFGEFLKPIPLSKEWLSRFNISQIDKFNHIEGEVIYQMSEKCNQPRLTFIKHSTNDSVFLPQYALKSFQYVHELQNLYFALVGEELVLQD